MTPIPSNERIYNPAPIEIRTPDTISRDMILRRRQISRHQFATGSPGSHVFLDLTTCPSGIAVAKCIHLTADGSMRWEPDHCLSRMDPENMLTVSKTLPCVGSLRWTCALCQRINLLRWTFPSHFQNFLKVMVLRDRTLSRHCLTRACIKLSTLIRYDIS